MSVALAVSGALAVALGLLLVFVLIMDIATRRVAPQPPPPTPTRQPTTAKVIATERTPEQLDMIAAYSRLSDETNAALAEQAKRERTRELQQELKDFINTI